MHSVRDHAVLGVDASRGAARGAGVAHGVRRFGADGLRPAHRFGRGVDSAGLHRRTDQRPGDSQRTGDIRDRPGHIELHDAGPAMGVDALGRAGRDPPPAIPVACRRRHGDETIASSAPMPGSSAAAGNRNRSIAGARSRFLTTSARANRTKADREMRAARAAFSRRLPMPFGAAAAPTNRCPTPRDIWRRCAARCRIPFPSAFRPAYRRTGSSWGLPPRSSP